MTTATKDIAANTDDGNEYPSGTWNSGACWFGHYGSSDEWACLRFQNIAITKNSTINSANLKLTARYTEGGSYTVLVRIYAQAIDDAAAPGAANLPHSMSLSTAYTDVTINTASGWASDTVYTYSVTSIIQEMVNRAGWASGNNINLLIVNNGSTGDHDVSAWDYAESVAKSADLELNWTEPASGTIPRNLHQLQEQGIS